MFPTQFIEALCSLDRVLKFCLRRAVRRLSAKPHVPAGLQEERGEAVCQNLEQLSVRHLPCLLQENITRLQYLGVSAINLLQLGEQHISYGVINHITFCFKITECKCC